MKELSPEDLKRLEQLEPQMKKKATMAFIYSVLGSFILITGLSLSYGLQGTTSYELAYYGLFVAVSVISGLLWWMSSRKRADIQKMVQDALHPEGVK